MTGRGEGSGDAQRLVSPPRALASLPSPAGTRCAAGSIDACSHHNEATRLGSCLWSPPGGEQPAWTKTPVGGVVGVVGVVFDAG